MTDVFLRKLLVFPILLMISVNFVEAQIKVAIISSSENQQTSTVFQQLESLLSKKFNILDISLVQNASQGIQFENLNNLAQEEAKSLGAAIGCDFFIILKSETITRSLSTRPFFYESYATAFVVSSKTGRLILWRLKKAEDAEEKKAENNLLPEVKILASEITTYVLADFKNREKKSEWKDFQDLPEENSPEFKDFRSPLPFKRLKPAYTDLAASYLVEATVDALVYLNEKGEIVNLEIVRWAGFGLDESVSETIRRMNWQPAVKNGKSLPIRVLLRYNFKKIRGREKN